jgi:hypothetical protein
VCWKVKRLSRVAAVFLLVLIAVQLGGLILPGSGNAAGSYSADALRSFGLGDALQDKGALYPAWSTENNISYQDNNSSRILVRTNEKIIGSAVNLSVGSGFYSAKPLKVGGQFGGYTTISNSNTATAMTHEASGNGISRSMQINAEDSLIKSYDSDSVNPTIRESQGFTQMKVDEHVEEGRVHLGVFQGSTTGYESQSGGGAAEQSGRSKGRIISDPSIEIDEDYIGSFDLSRNMTLSSSSVLVESQDDWLNCCYGGFAGMARTDRAGLGSRSIFGCEC